MLHKRTNYTRRSALYLLTMAGVLSASPSVSLADTKEELSNAQERLAQAQAELDAIASEYEALSAEQSVTLDQLDAVEKRVASVKKRIRRLEKELYGKQEILAQNVSDEYKDGGRGVIDLLLRSSSVEDLISNFYYYGKITEEQAALIQDVKETRRQYAEQMTELEAEQEELEEVSRIQEQQLDSMREMQLEAQELIDGLDKEVRKLIAKRDAELLAAQQEAERARQQREEAAQKAAEEEAAKEEAAKEEAAEAEEEEQVEEESVVSAESTKKTTTVVEVEETEDDADDDSYAASGGSTGSAAAVIASCKSTPSPGLGLCAGWCSNVMINAGYGFVPGNANDMYADFCHSSNRSDLRPGMAVAVSTHPHTSAGRIYGHIGMYVGNGTMMDNVGFIRTISLDEWCSFYGQTVPARWGWLNNIVLT